MYRFLKEANLPDNLIQYIYRFINSDDLNRMDEQLYHAISQLDIATMWLMHDIGAKLIRDNQHQVKYKPDFRLGKALEKAVKDKNRLFVWHLGKLFCVEMPQYPRAKYFNKLGAYNFTCVNNPHVKRYKTRSRDEAKYRFSFRGIAALQLAVESKNQAILKLMIEMGIANGKASRYALLTACRKGYPQAVQFLLQAGVDPNDYLQLYEDSCSEFYFPLQVILSSNKDVFTKEKIITLLIEAGACYSYEPAYEPKPKEKFCWNNPVIPFSNAMNITDQWHYFILNTQSAVYQKTFLKMRAFERENEQKTQQIKHLQQVMTQQATTLSKQHEIIQALQMNMTRLFAKVHQLEQKHASMPDKISELTLPLRRNSL